MQGSPVVKSFKVLLILRHGEYSPAKFCVVKQLLLKGNSKGADLIIVYFDILLPESEVINNFEWISKIIDITLILKSCQISPISILKEKILAFYGNFCPK